MDVQSCYEKLIQALFSENSKLGRLIRGIDFIIVILIPFAIAVLAVIKPPSSQDGLSFLWWVVMIGLGIVQAVFYRIKRLKPETPQEMFYFGHQIYQDNIEKNSIISSLVKRVDYGSIYFNIEESFTALSHPNFIKKNGSNKVKIFGIIEIMLSMIVQKRHELFGFDNDIWTFKIYLSDPNTEVLKCLCGFRSDRHPSGAKVDIKESPGRFWKAGEGHIGRAFMDEEAKITGDANDDEVWNLMGPTKDNCRDYDRLLYRSFASIPIMMPSKSANREDAVGVVIATSNQVNRFNKENCTILGMLADQISVILSQEKK